MKRVLIKISGEVLTKEKSDVYGNDKFTGLCHAIKSVVEAGIGVSAIIGGGNLIRGVEYDSNTWIRRETADSIGMLATAMNSILLREFLVSLGLDIAIVSSLSLPFDVEANDIYTVRRLVAEDKIVVFACGVGLPYFSTDTMAVVAASMSDCDALLKATKTDGIYDKDPKKYADATYIPELTYNEAIQKNLKIMDAQAFALAEQRDLPIHVFSMYEPNCFVRSIRNELKQSVVSSRK
jgi:uridylate kinase